MSRDKLEFIGLDLETSGTFAERHGIIQIGIAIPRTSSGGLNSCSEYVGGYRFTNLGPEYQHGSGPEVEWSYDAAKVHEIPVSTIDQASPVAAVDFRTAQWVNDFSETYRNRRVMVGWNVAGFDRKFLDKYMPKTAAAFSYRTVDLNAVVFTLVESGLRKPTGGFWDYRAIKKFVKENAAQRAGWATPAWHDAEYDAITSLYAYRELIALLRGQYA